jgi:hypothetical protein
MMNEPNYNQARNIKYLVEGIPLYRWCHINGYSYGAAVQMLQRGISIDDMVKRIKSNYVCNNNLKMDLHQFIEKYSREYQTASRERRLEIRSLTESYCKSRQKVFDTTSDVFESIVTGKYARKTKREFSDNSFDEVWLPIPEDTRYQVSSKGNFRRLLKNGSYKVIRPYLKGRKNKENTINRCFMEIKIGLKVRIAARIVAEVHLDKPSSKHTIVHLIDSSNARNIEVSNLKWVTPWMHGHLTGQSVKTSIPVHLLDDDGNIEETFSSVREAAKELNISYTSVIEICKGRKKKPLFNLMYGDTHDEYIPTWGFGGGKKRIEVQS